MPVCFCSSFQLWFCCDIRSGFGLFRSLTDHLAIMFFFWGCHFWLWHLNVDSRKGWKFTIIKMSCVWEEAEFFYFVIARHCLQVWNWVFFFVRLQALFTKFDEIRNTGQLLPTASLEIGESFLFVQFSSRCPHPPGPLDEQRDLCSSSSSGGFQTLVCPTCFCKALRYQNTWSFDIALNLQ